VADDDATGSGRAPDPAYRETYPWHAHVWASLTRDLTRLPHALLLHGQEGLGKQAFAFRLANTLLCLHPGTDVSACSRCKSCLLFKAGTHPDLVVTELVDDSTAITVDQVRALGDFLNLRPHTTARKVIILNPAESMNPNAANALLKLLEEPPLGSVFLLVTPQHMRLPATIRSRCALVAFRPPSRAAALDWLARRMPDDAERALDLAAGAPLLALALAGTDAAAAHADVVRDLDALMAGRGDPLRCAARWKTFGAERSLRWAQRYLAQRIRTQMTDSEQRYNSETSYLFRFFDVASEARQLSVGPLDETLLLEDVLIRSAQARRDDRLN